MAVGNELELFTNLEAASAREVAALDRQSRAHDERGLVGGEKGDRLGDFVWLAEPAHGVHALDLLDVLISARFFRQA
jgi:hypothetical protein